ncbi:hypothetical protein DFH07DRAFT_951722 [Mycena maculata]|uniref:Uncharacterized protein n=1 Tax=Mycena maculata TaxID=230809 RepID=A0AAD7K204_9AGAR|nr:hypothetical protein DFH07DRAFT_951722 [Mycena maculata]
MSDNAQLNLGHEILAPPQSNSGTNGSILSGTSNTQQGPAQNQAPAGPATNQADSGGSAPPEGGISPVVQRVLDDCEVIFEQYRLARITKPKALSEIHHKLLTAAVLAPQTESAFASFLKALDDHDEQERGAADHGGVHSHAPVHTSNAGAGAEFDRGFTPPIFEGPGGRSNAATLEAQFPWVATEFIESSIQPLSPNLTETLRILKVLLQDPKLAKRSITTSARAPEFPESEWTNLLNGRAVNFDAVLSSFFSTTSHDEHSESLGSGLELRFGTVAPTKFVRDAGTWTIAFDRVCAATLFIFTHRARELTTYREYIVGLFAATSSLFHDRIIAFDKAVRKFACQRWDIELTDFNKFLHIKTAVIDSIGVGVIDAQCDSSSGADRKPKSQVCNNWNNGRCTAPAIVSTSAMSAEQLDTRAPTVLTVLTAPTPDPTIPIPPRRMPGAALNDWHHPDVPAASQAAAIALGFTLDPSSNTTYSSATNSYLTFVKMHGLPVEPTEETLSFFTVYIQLEPFFPEVRARRNGPLVSRTLAGCTRRFGTPVTRKRPITEDDIVQVISDIGHTVN